MYDNMHLHFALPAHDGEAVERMLSSSAFANWTLTGEVQEHVRVNYRGFRIDYWFNERRGRLWGSLHTFALEHKRGCFTAELVKSACTALADGIGIAAGLLHVCRLEISVNLPTPTSPQPFLISLLEHKRKPFYLHLAPGNTKEPLLSTATYRDYRIKAYNKGEYDKSKGRAPVVCQPLLRFEIVFTRSRPLLKLVNRSHLTLEDLAQPAVLLAFGGFLMKTWKLVKRTIELPFEGLSLEEARSLNSYNTPGIWRWMKSTMPPSTFRRHRRQCDRLWEEAQQRLEPHPYHAIFSQSLSLLLPH